MGKLDYQYHAQAFARRQKMLAEQCPVFTWGGQTYQILPSTARLKKDLASGAFQLKYDFYFNCLVTQFYSNTVTTPIQVVNMLLQTWIGYLGGDYKVAGVDIGAGGQVLEIAANAKAQGAGGRR